MDKETNNAVFRTKGTNRGRTDAQIRVRVEEKIGDNKAQDGVTEVLESVTLSTQFTGPTPVELTFRCRDWDRRDGPQRHDLDGHRNCGG